ncbi:protein-tyrosine-phosphatase [Robiginitalea sp.]|nr:protein-tyrosine-phosphatase [Robiginitalea sp.]
MAALKLYPELKGRLKEIQDLEIPPARQQVLQPLIAYIQHKLDVGETAYLNFICTHNSRRSQFSQVWAQTAADYYSLPVRCLSGGVEVTACNERTVVSLERFGFRVSAKGTENPKYGISHSENCAPISAFSKLFDDPENNAESFAAVMTCSHADENCPFIPGTEKRISVRYEDPKAFDDTPLEAEKYDERSIQIASEMFYVFSRLASTS